MKKMALALLGVAILASQVLAAACNVEGKPAFCQWNKGKTNAECWNIDDEYGSVEKADAAKGIVACAVGACTCANLLENCMAFGYVYTGSVGKGEEECAGEWAGIGNDPNYAVTYCKWDTGCEAVPNADEEENCIKNGSLFSDAACTNWTGKGKDPSAKPLGCCEWETEAGSCYTIYEGEDEDGVDGADKASDCQGGDNRFWAGKCPAEGTCPTTAPLYPPPSPILGNTLKLGLIVAPFGNSLHISSDRNATISLFDMKGKEILTGKVNAGNSVFDLDKKVSMGSYYAVVKAGSNTQKVNVIIK